MIAELYSNTHVMTGDVPCGAGSSAAVMYYNDTVTYPDNTSEPLDLKILPLPQNENCPKYATQAGVGLCAYRTTDQKAEAASVFAHWLTEGERNLSFVAETGYMPVRNDAYPSLKVYSFQKESYKELYSALSEIRNTQTFLREPNFVGYYDKVNTLYAELRETADNHAGASKERRECRRTCRGAVGTVPVCTITGSFYEQKQITSEIAKAHLAPQAVSLHLCDGNSSFGTSRYPADSSRQIPHSQG